MTSVNITTTKNTVVVDESGGTAVVTIKTAGAVDSVNTQTGAVSLGIQNMNDYAAPTGVVDGDVLTWNAAASQFQPVDPEPPGSPVDALVSVDGDAVKYGTAPTLGTDTTDVVIPTMGQVRAEIASNEVPVDSVNTQTGAVSLGIQNMNDYAAPTGVVDGDVLQWSATDSAFKPTQLEPVATSGDYNDLTNTPDLSLKADLVNGKVQADQLPPAAVRKTVDITATLDAGATTTGQVTGTGATGFLLSCQTNVDCWIRLYTDSALMTADAGRAQADDPVAGSGVLFEALYTTVSENTITPGTTYFNLAGDDKLYYRLTNESAVNGAAMTVTLKLLPME